MNVKQALTEIGYSYSDFKERNAIGYLFYNSPKLLPCIMIKKKSEAERVFKELLFLCFPSVPTSFLYGLANGGFRQRYNVYNVELKDNGIFNFNDGSILLSLNPAHLNPGCGRLFLFENKLILRFGRDVFGDSCELYDFIFEFPHEQNTNYFSQNEHTGTTDSFVPYPNNSTAGTRKNRM